MVRSRGEVVTQHELYCELYCTTLSGDGVVERFCVCVYGSTHFFVCLFAHV